PETIEGRGERLDRDHRRMGICGDGRRLYCDRVRLERCTPESRRDTGIRRARRRLLDSRFLSRGPAAWRHCPRGAGMGPAPAALAVAGKGSSDWDYASSPVVGPLVGGLLAGVALRVIGVQ